MLQLFNQIKRILSTKFAGPVCMAIAILAKMIVQVADFSFGGDKSYQLLAAKNFLAGKGISLGEVSIDNLSALQYEPLIGWPPGYSLVIAPFLWIYDGDYILAALTFDLLCILPFFYYLFKLTDFLIPEKWLRNIFILFTGLFIYPFTSKLSTDLVSLTCMMAAFYYILQIMDRKVIGRYIVQATVSIFLAGLFRYHYVPVGLAIPFILLVAGFINKQPQWKKASLYLGAGLIILFSSLLLFQHSYTGSPAFIKKTDSGFHAENLGNMYPIFPASVFDVETGMTIFSKATKTNFHENREFFSLLGYILFFIMLGYAIFWAVRTKLKLNERNEFAIYIGVAISLLLIALLAYLSATSNRLYWFSGEHWTYLIEHRYFLFVCVFIQLLVFLLLFRRYKQLTRFWKGVSIICAVLMIINSVHKTFYISKLLGKEMKELASGVAFARDADFVLIQYKKVKETYPQHDIIIASPRNTICNYAGLENIKSIYKPKPGYFFRPPTSTQPTKILLILHQRHLEDFKSVLDLPHSDRFHESNGWHFFIVNVDEAI